MEVLQIRMCGIRTSVENQEQADTSGPAAAGCVPARVPVSVTCEPLLGPVDLVPFLRKNRMEVIVGGVWPRTRAVDVARTTCARYGSRCEDANVPFSSAAGLQGRVGAAGFV